MKLYYLSFLPYIFIIGCISNSGIQPMQGSSSTPSSIPLIIPTPQASLAGPETNPSAGPADVDIYYSRTTPEKVCYDEVVTVTGKLSSNGLEGQDKVSVLLENVTKTVDRLPPLYFEHILLNKVQVQPEKEFVFSFKMEKTMKSFDGTATLGIEPGRYAIYLRVREPSLYGVGTIEVTNCLKR